MIEQHLYISTGHVSSETLGLLDISTFDSRLESGWPSMTVASYDCGTIITVPEEITEKQRRSIPKDLVGVLDFAREHGASLIRFDQSADPVPGLPEYPAKLRFAPAVTEVSEVTAPLDKDGIIARMKKEVLDDMASGRVPVTVTSFGDLHSHVDANYYGGFLEDKVANELERIHGDEKYIGFMNVCQEAIHEWLAGGRETTPEGTPVAIHRIILESSCLEDILASLDDFDVKLIWNSRAASCAVFEGREECLRAMHAEHWNTKYPGSYPA